jgi:hypothetical protein
VTTSSGTSIHAQVRTAGGLPVRFVRRGAPAPGEPVPSPASTAPAGRTARTRLNLDDAWCEALFASALQRSAAPAADSVAAAISRAVRRLGTRGCVSRIVFGDRIQISPGLLAIQAGGVAALVAGVVMVASDPALSQLREQASKLRSAVRDTASHATLRSQPGRSGADAAAGGSRGDAISSGASPEGAPGNPAPGGVVPGGLPDGDMQGGTARGGVNSRTAPGAANSRTALDGAKEGPIPGQQVAGDRPVRR